jgi:hypothetical protein
VPQPCSPWKRGLSCLKEHFCDCLTRKYNGYFLPQSNIFYNIEKVWKCKYLKLSCILDLRLWTKSYDQKILKIKNFKSPSPLGTLGDWVALESKFSNVWQNSKKNKHCSHQTIFTPLESFQMFIIPLKSFWNVNIKIHFLFENMNEKLQQKEDLGGQVFQCLFCLGKLSLLLLKGEKHLRIWHLILLFLI